MQIVCNLLSIGLRRDLPVQESKIHLRMKLIMMLMVMIVIEVSNL